MRQETTTWPDNRDMNAWQVVVDFFSAVVNLVAVVFIALQVRGAKQNLHQLDLARESELRPYLAIDLVKIQVGSEMRVYLQIENHGRTPALATRLAIQASGPWHYVKQHRFAYLQPAGISQIAPGQTRSYFLGRLDGGGAFAQTLETGIEVTATYDSRVGVTGIEEVTSLTLADSSFQTRS